MAMEKRHAANDRISKIHHQIYRAAVGNVHGIEPYRIFHRLSVDGVCEEVNLVNVKRMHLSSWVHYAPVMQRTDIYCQHGAGIHFEFLAINVEALFVFSERDNELRFARFDAFENSRRKGFEN